MWPLSRLFGKDDIGKGYADISLVDVVVRKTMALRGGRRLDDILPGEPLLPTLTGVAAAGDKAPLRVIDFGGAAGLHYFVAKEAFPNRSFRWAVIETEQMAEKAAALANDEVQFFTRLENGMSWLGGIDLMHCVGALQYVPEPTETLEALLALKAPIILWSKLMLGERYETFIQTSRLRDNGPGPLLEGIPDRKVTYTGTHIGRGDFLARHQRAAYRLAWKAKDTDSFLFSRDTHVQR
jgi:putative methyltransferase (TIGR04325 family)